MKEGTESPSSPIEQRIAESAAAASAAKAELDAAEAALEAFKAREAATEVPETAQAAPTDDGYKTPEVEAALEQAPTDGAVRPEIGVTPPPQHNDADTGGTAAQPKATRFIDRHPYFAQATPDLEQIMKEIEEVIGVTPPPRHNDADAEGTAAPSPDIEPSICPGNIATAACIATVIIGAVAMVASM